MDLKKDLLEENLHSLMANVNPGECTKTGASSNTATSSSNTTTSNNKTIKKKTKSSKLKSANEMRKSTKKLHKKFNLLQQKISSLIASNQLEPINFTADATNITEIRGNQSRNNIENDFDEDDDDDEDEDDDDEISEVFTYIIEKFNLFQSRYSHVKTTTYSETNCLRLFK